MADNPNPQLDAASPTTEGPTMAERRKKWLGILAAVVIGLGLLFTLYHFLIGVRHVSTDNAYVGADTAQVTPLVAGPVQTVRVANTQIVHKGDILVTIDPSDFQIAVARAAADLASAERQFQQTSATGGALEAQVTARDSDIQRAQAEMVAAQSAYDKARVDLTRRQGLAKSGAVSGDELTAATNAFAAAQAQLAVAKAGIAQARANRAAAAENFNANQALVRGSMQDNPDVQAARAKLDSAKLDLSRTVIRAPFDGVIAQRNVQVGQRIAAGTPIMTVVPLGNMYVDANFKEGQLKKVRIGQPARLKADIYGGSVEYHGKVIGIAGGTGSAFAIIPAQNATGNWIKVVQRLPVRIMLDPNELKQHPLRVGLSMDVTVDVGG
jgi:membrane fusion protein (multidrug efflux system)